MKLTVHQQKALAVIDENAFTLVHGVTGSGKTEIYIRAAEKIVQQNKQVIVLIPEISLTKQTVERFQKKFNCLELHSKLTPKQRRENWQKIVDGDIEMVIGARSALFVPLQNLGLIIIDEEHDPSYKQDNNPRYHTRDVALKRAEIENAKLVLGSATPDIETYYRFTNQYAYIYLPSRVDDRPLPPTQIIDMRQEIKNGNYSVLSNILQKKIADRLKKQEKIMLFLNKRGYASYVFCRDCGFSFECPHCHVSLTYHSDNNTIRCHYCNYLQQVTSLCPQCGSKKFKFSGAGTQKIEALLKSTFANAKILRMDSDSTKKRGSHQQILDKFINEDYDILLGTQMITKGHDFPQVTLVGVLLADLSLRIPNYRAAENTFQTITQVAGRTGRGKAGGEVIIQSYLPDHYAITCASRHDFHGFYAQEIKIRQELNYPPFAKLILITISSQDNNLAQQQALEISKRYQNVLGPVPAVISKLRGFYRWQILIRNEDINYEDFAKIDKVKIEINVDPVNFY